MFDELHEECGVFGAYRVSSAAALSYYGLHACSIEARGMWHCRFRWKEYILPKGKRIDFRSF